MADYDMYPMDLDRYPSGGQRSSQWGGSAYHPSAAMSDYSRGRGMSRQGSSYGGVGGAYGIGGYDNYNDTGVVMPPGTIARSYSQPLGSRHGSMAGRMSPSPFIGNSSGTYADMPPLEEYYDYDYDYRDGYRNTPSRRSSLAPSHRSRTYSNGHLQYPGGYAMAGTGIGYNTPGMMMQNPVSMPYTATNYYDLDRGRSRSRGRSRGRSRSRSRRSRSFSGYRNSYYPSQTYGVGYNTMQGYGYGTNATVISSSRHQPTVVPISGGTGGYVIVPPAGQKVKVVDPNRPYNHLSMVERLFSPSTWNLGSNKNKQRVIRV